MLKTRLIVHVSDAKASSNPNEVIMTYSLGSCIGVSLYDRVAQVGGMLHYQLPDSKIDPDRASEKPCMFADTGMKLLLEKLRSLGANQKRMQVKIAGGAEMGTGPKGFEIGKRNYVAIKKILWRNGMFIDDEETGGSIPRNMSIDIDDGSVVIKSDGLERQL